MWFADARAAGPASILWPYAGYLHLIPRSIAVLEAALPTAAAPLVGTLITLAIIAGVAVAGFRVWPPLALPVVLLPNTVVEIGSPTYLHFYLAIALLFGLLARRVGRPGLVGLVVCSISGPSGLLLSPLFAARAWVRRDRDSVQRLLCVAIPAAVQALFLAVAGRSAVAEAVSPVDALVIGAGHVAATIIGTRFTLAGLNAVPTPIAGVAVLAIAVLLVVAARSVPRWLNAALAYILIVTVISTILAGSDDREHLLSPVSAPRYFHLAGAAVAGLSLFALSRGSRAGLVLVGLLIFGWIGDFRLEALPPSAWASDSSCLDSPGPCTVPVYPGGKWDIHWPP